jgi:hypothetical protein
MAYELDAAQCARRLKVLYASWRVRARDWRKGRCGDDAQRAARHALTFLLHAASRRALQMFFRRPRGGAHSFAVCRGASTAASDELRYLKSAGGARELMINIWRGTTTPRCLMAVRTRAWRGNATHAAPRTPEKHVRAGITAAPAWLWRGGAADDRSSSNTAAAAQRAALRTRRVCESCNPVLPWPNSC